MSKQITQAVFEGLPPEYRWALVCPDSGAFAFEKEPKPQDSEFTDWDYSVNARVKFLGAGYDARDWQNSLIERETVISKSEEIKSLLKIFGWRVT